ncbi:hypothetical protein BJY04DRAFT_214701 [Aspergillus karnatakaensis]|uniref:uncharacterized protein n=1 Tax=Aspergillus karnatakaensis TaxID=1810916 RepID=UPI003CCD15CE
MEGLHNDPRLSFTHASTEIKKRPDLSDEGQIDSFPSRKHPIPQLQGAFEESIYEASQGADRDWIVDLDAQSRRRELLENPQYERLCGRKWRQRTDERYHPFWKLSAQMSFGLHLLVKKTAKSNAAVLSILQAHVDEMDGFVSRTAEDFLIIQIDLRTRIQYLSLPLESLDIFDEMLGDRSFRLAMIDYNERIERAIERFTVAISDALKDIQKGKDAIGGLWHYLAQSAKENAPLLRNMAAIFNSMLANTEGWNSAFSKLRRKGIALQYAITQLNRAITEMQRRVGVASRKEVMSFVQPSQQQTPRANSGRSVFNKGLSVYASSLVAIEKPLPSDPALALKSNPKPRHIVGAIGRLAHQKSVPNLTAARELDSYQITENAHDRARSVTGAPARGSDSGSILPKLSKTISRRLSKAKITSKVTVQEVTEEIPTRPSTSASKTFKSFRKSRYELPPQLPSQPQEFQRKQQGPSYGRPQSMAKGQGTSSAMTRGETMKDQLLQYFKTDRALDAWETLTEKEKKASQPITQKDGLWSKFQAVSSGVRSEDLPANVFRDDIQKQMEWLNEETKNLNTYSLKPRDATAPRVHTILEHMSLQQQFDEGGHQRNCAEHLKDLEMDESIITALPAFPLPPVIDLARYLCVC